MVRQINKERSAAIFFDELQDGICQAITEIVAVVIEVLILAEADILRKDDGFKTLSTGGDGARATSPQIPHTEESCSISTVAQGFSDRDNLGVQFRFTVGSQQFLPWRSGWLPRINDGVDAMSGRILTGHETGASGSAVGGTGIGLRKHEATSGQPIKVGRFREPVAHETDITPTHVVHQNQDDIRFISGRGAAGQTGQQSDCNEGLQRIHCSCRSY